MSAQGWVNLDPDIAFSVSKMALTNAGLTEGKERITGEEEENPLAIVVWEGQPHLPKLRGKDPLSSHGKELPFLPLLFPW
jgi:hypothetical protein